MLFISGATRSPLCHKHRNDRSEHNHPVSIAAQIRLGIQTIRSILSHAPLIWTRAVKVKKYLADMRDMGGMAATMAGFFGEWTPASTTVCVNQLSMPCARVELDMIAIYPKA